MCRLFLLLFFFSFGMISLAQKDSIPEKLNLSADFRFRFEQDWNSLKSDGTYRTDRTRLRYRMRFGMNYNYNDIISFGMRIRTGQWNKQQDSQLTLGAGFKEFGALPIGFDKAFLKINKKKFTTWIGKNSFPFKKQNELFWSDNVSPEGIYLGYKWKTNSTVLNSIIINMGHFIIATKGKSLDLDSYFQGIQVQTNFFNNRIQFFPSFYYFNNIPDIPDGFQTNYLQYAITHLGFSCLIFEKQAIRLEADYYYNWSDYSSETGIQPNLTNQKQGFVGALSIGELKDKKDFKIKLTFTYLERFSAVDFLAQNDWVRWDYSSAGSPDGRLTNFQGVEVQFGYVFNKRFKLIMRNFYVQQLVSYGNYKETGYRLRFDLDIAI